LAIDCICVGCGLRRSAPSLLALRHIVVLTAVWAGVAMEQVSFHVEPHKAAGERVRSRSAFGPARRSRRVRGHGPVEVSRAGTSLHDEATPPSKRSVLAVSRVGDAEESCGDVCGAESRMSRASLPSRTLCDSRIHVRGTSERLSALSCLAVPRETIPAASESAKIRRVCFT
jgi:hypothetical protein